MYIKVRVRTIRRESTREESSGLFSRKNMKARTAVDREEKSLLRDFGSEICLGTKNEEEKVRRQ